MNLDVLTINMETFTTNLDTYIQNVNNKMQHSPTISIILVGSRLYRKNTDTFESNGTIKVGKNHEYPDIIHSLQNRFPNTSIEVACIDPQYQNTNKSNDSLNKYSLPDDPYGLTDLDTDFNGIYHDKLSNFYVIPQYFTNENCVKINRLALEMIPFGSIILFFDFSGNEWTQLNSENNLYKAPANCLADVAGALYNPVIEMINVGNEGNEGNDRWIFKIYNPSDFGQLISDFQVWQKIIETMPTKDRMRQMRVNGKGNIALTKLRFTSQKISINIGNLLHSHLKILKIMDIKHNLRLYPYLKNGFWLGNPELDSVIAYIIWRAGNTSYKVHLICDLLEVWRKSDIDELQTFIAGELNRHLMVVLRLKYKEKICNHLEEIEYKNHNECQNKIQVLKRYFKNLW